MNQVLVLIVTTKRVVVDQGELGSMIAVDERLLSSERMSLSVP